MARDRSTRPEAKPLRLFAAIEVPGGAKDALARAFAPWRAAFPEARWAPRENQHVTLKFLGRTWPRLTDWVPERVAEAAASCGAFATHLDGVGAFPSARRARVVWAGLDDRAGRMAEVALALDAALSREFAPETRAFTPHLTVARSDPPLHLPEGFADTELEPVVWQVDHVTLFRSHLGRPAPRYEPLGTFPLR
ncbi:MAG: RNA 2',3'-cyclic phosphodiesterase [Actinomycetota bacterium]